MKAYSNLTFACVFIGLVAGCATRVSTKSSRELEPLCLAVQTDKSQCSVGEDILITCTLSNRSSHAVRLLPWGGAYEIEWIHVFIDGLKLNQATDFTTAIVDPAPPRAEDFVMLGPGQPVTNSFVARVEDGAVWSPALPASEQYNGLHLKFHASAVKLPRVGLYWISAEYRADAYWADKAQEQSGYQDVFVGTLASPCTAVEMRTN